MPIAYGAIFVIETDFQALFDSYASAAREKSEQPVPQKLHLMIYNYARLRHQQTSDVSADFYLHVATKIEGILQRYDARRVPFYQYLASMLNFEYNHFLRRRRLPRSQTHFLSLDDLQERDVQLTDQTRDAKDTIGECIARLPQRERQYAKLALALPLTYGDLRSLTRRVRNDGAKHWGILRSYREYLHFVEAKRTRVIAERDRLSKLLTQLAHDIRAASPKIRPRVQERIDNAQKKFFSIDARIPIRIVAAVTSDPIATAQRQMKKAITLVRNAWLQREKHKIGGLKQKKREAN